MKIYNARAPLTCPDPIDYLTVRASNIKLLVEKASVDWYHSAAIIAQEKSANEKEIQQLQKML